MVCKTRTTWTPRSANQLAGGHAVLARGDLGYRHRIDRAGEIAGDRARQRQPVGAEGRSGRVLPERPVRVDDPDAAAGGADGAASRVSPRTQSWW